MKKRIIVGISIAILLCSVVFCVAAEFTTQSPPPTTIIPAFLGFAFKFGFKNHNWKRDKKHIISPVGWL